MGGAACRAGGVPLPRGRRPAAGPQRLRARGGAASAERRSGRHLGGARHSADYQVIPKITKIKPLPRLSLVCFCFVSPRAEFEFDIWNVTFRS